MRDGPHAALHGCILPPPLPQLTGHMPAIPCLCRLRRPSRKWRRRLPKRSSLFIARSWATCLSPRGLWWCTTSRTMLSGSRSPKAARYATPPQRPHCLDLPYILGQNRIVTIGISWHKLCYCKPSSLLMTTDDGQQGGDSDWCCDSALTL